MNLHLVDWSVIVASVALTFWIGLRFARRAGTSVDEYFLAGRSLPWWIAGTSMVATSFSCDTPLVISGWVRDGGIWKNWLWWGYAISGMLGAFLFAPLWRRGAIMTKAEFAELRYGGKSARLLRGFLGVMHAGVVNTLTLCWVLLAAAKILDVLFGVERVPALVLSCSIAVAYSMASGLWGVVLTDLFQFAMAMVGAIFLGVIAWNAAGGGPAIEAGMSTTEYAGRHVLDFVPSPGEGGFMTASFWTAPFTSFVVYLGVWWWAIESVDGTGPGVQRVLATRDERDGLLATMWFNVAHYALRPWPWVMVALASLLILPNVSVQSPVDGEVKEIVAGSHLVIRSSAPEGESRLSLAASDAGDWNAAATVKVGDQVKSGDIIARTDSERAYIVMMNRYLPIGLLGLVVASLLAAFMSTVDTHVNVAASFFLNDVYRRFLRPDASASHYVLIARLSSLVVMIIGAVMAAQATSIASIFVFVMAFLGGVGPIYLLRWIWWRITAVTEIAASVASAVSTVVLTHVIDIHWMLGPLSPDGKLSDEGRIILVVLCSLGTALISMLAGARPDPAALTAFYRRVRPIGFWGPVRALCPDVAVERTTGRVVMGCVGGLALTYGLLFTVGHTLLGHGTKASISAVTATIGAVLTVRAISRRTSS